MCVRARVFVCVCTLRVYFVRFVWRRSQCLPQWRRLAAVGNGQVPEACIVFSSRRVFALTKRCAVPRPVSGLLHKLDALEVQVHRTAESLSATSDDLALARVDMNQLALALEAKLLAAVQDVKRDVTQQLEGMARAVDEVQGELLALRGEMRMVSTPLVRCEGSCQGAHHTSPTNSLSCRTCSAG